MKMGSARYDVLDGENVVALNMDFETAVVLLNGLFDKYYKESSLAFTIRRHVDD